MDDGELYEDDVDDGELYELFVVEFALLLMFVFDVVLLLLAEPEALRPAEPATPPEASYDEVALVLLGEVVEPEFVPLYVEFEL